MTLKTKNSKIYLLIVLGILSAFGPFITDFYLPALPSLNGYFQTTSSLVQLSLTFSMVGLATGQLIIGPLSDKYGRKSPLIISMIIFCITTIGCIYSTNINWFIFFRLIQGAAGAGGLVISKSIAIDLYKGNELSIFFSMLSGVQGLAPVCAPVLGGFLLEITDWKGIFWILLAIGLLLILVLFFFKESFPKEYRKKGNISSTFYKYIPTLQNKQFMKYVLIQAFAMGVMFAYIAASPFIFQQHYKLSPILYSICFGANALAIMLGSFIVSVFRNAESAMKTGVAGFGIVSIAVACVLVTNASIIIVEGTLFLFLIFLGLILPSSTALALDKERENSGNASALLGFLMFLFGGIISPLTGLGNMLYTTSFIILVCCLGASVCAFNPTGIFTSKAFHFRNRKLKKYV